MINHYVEAVFYQYYSTVEVTGRENVPRKEAVIFAPNHQNALMDALIVLFSVPQDVVFLARADVFKKRFMAYIANSVKMLPVFRQRDGAGELGKNHDIFDITVDLLHRRHYLALMPEGNHGHQRRLRPLVKGIFRIAFKAQEPYGNKPFVKIIPTGLEFGDYVKQNQTLLINYGKPIEVSDFWDQYLENPARAINALKERLSAEMKPQMIHIETEEFYEAVMGLRTIFNDRMREILEIKGTKLSDRFRADKHMIEVIDRAIEKEQGQVEEPGRVLMEEPGPVEELGQVLMEDPGPVRTLAGKVDRYFDEVRSLNIRDWVVREKGFLPGRSIWRYLTLIVTFPIFLFGLLTNAIPYLLPVYLVRNVKDKQFHSSVKAGLSMLILFPWIYLLMALLVGIFTGPWWIWAAFLGSLYPAGKIALHWYFRWKKTVRGSWFRRQLRRKKSGALELVELRKEIMVLTEEIVNP